MARYELTLDKSFITGLKKLDDEEEELLGIELALSEIKETFNHSGEVSASFTLANEEEVDEILDFLDRFFGKRHDPGTQPWRKFREER